MKRIRTTTFLALATLGCPAKGEKAPPPPAAKAPAALDPAKAYAELLKTRVKDGRVDYAAIEADRAGLDAYVAHLAVAELPEDRNARIGFYVDAYNALVIHAVLAHGKPRSVLDVDGFFNEQKHRVAGQEVTLDELEKKLLNPFAQDPRTHFVLVCGAVGCPILERTPYAGSDMDARMDAATRRYLGAPTGAVVEEGRLRLSMIFSWYEADFGGKEGVLTFAKKHLPEEAAAKLGDAPTVELIDYNWTLNQQ